jgi:hypothetical protein
VVDRSAGAVGKQLPATQQPVPYPVPPRSYPHRYDRGARGAQVRGDPPREPTRNGGVPDVEAAALWGGRPFLPDLLVQSSHGRAPAEPVLHGGLDGGTRLRWQRELPDPARPSRRTGPLLDRTPGAVRRGIRAGTSRRVAGASLRRAGPHDFPRTKGLRHGPLWVRAARSCQRVGHRTRRWTKPGEVNRSYR